MRVKEKIITLLLIIGCAIISFPLWAYSDSIIDSHQHPKQELDVFFTQVKSANVEKVIVMSTPNSYKSGRWQRTKEVIKFTTESNHSIFLCDTDFIGFLYRDDLEMANKELNILKQQIKNGDCKGIGEAGLRHYDKRAKLNGRGGQSKVWMDLNHPMILDMLLLANQYSLPIIFHIEPTYSVTGENYIGEVKAWYKDKCLTYPKITFIATHTGMMPPKDLEDIFTSCNNVVADFKFIHSKGSARGFHDLYPINSFDAENFHLGVIHSHWIDMMNRFSDRFLFGSDWKYGRRGYFEDYEGHIEMVRNLVESLDPSTQQKVMYENAKQIFNLD